MYRYEVKSRTRTKGYTILELMHAGKRKLSFLPGQYVAVSAVRGFKQTPSRCFSIVSTPGSKTLELAFRNIGGSTKTLDDLFEGERVNVQGPFGDFVLPDNNHPIAMITSGIGLTPALGILRSIDESNSNRQVAVLASAGSLDNLPGIALLKEIATRRQSVSLKLYSGAREASSVNGRISPAVIADLVATMPEDTEYFICGPEAFTNTIADSLEDLDIDNTMVHSESFTQLATTTAGAASVRKIIWGSVAGTLAVFGLMAGAAVANYFGAPAASALNTAPEPTPSPSSEMPATSPASQNAHSTQTYSQPSTSTYAPARSSAS